MARERTRPVIPSAYNSVNDKALMSVSEVLKIVGICQRSLYARMSDGKFPLPDCDALKSIRGTWGKSKNVLWKMKTIRDYVRDFDKWMDGEMKPMAPVEREHIRD